MATGIAEQHAPTVLVVDDEAPVRDLVGELLTDAGYRVVTAADSAAAAEAADRMPRLDAVVVDLVLPGGGGAELAAHLRARHPDAAVVLVSGYPREEAAVPDDAHFLQKPFSAARLREALAEALAARRPPPG